MKPRILILAQTPPPYHGQALMQELLVKSSWNWADKKHIRLEFSDNFSNVGKFQFNKILKLFIVILKVHKYRIHGPIDLLYYPPTGTYLVPTLRDIILLLCIRWTTKKVAFHFHAGGFDNSRNFPVIKYFAKIAYNAPDLAIVLLKSLESEVLWINPKNIVVIPNGIQDEFIDRDKNNDVFTILSVGNLIKGKGVYILLEAINNVIKSGLQVKAEFVGAWGNNKFKTLCEEFVVNNKMEKVINFEGVKTGKDKWKYYSRANIFCFPSYLTENQPVVLLEAMMAGLPIITSKWRALPDIVIDGWNGLVIPPASVEDLTQAILYLYNNTLICQQMGEHSRKSYENDYRLDNYTMKLESSIKELIQN